ncbi:unnamed protein product [Polarella glacialis]|uniref:Uncharacterized protein n=1 Tax=Polarella glacialis TaxID=89957 RepID=A0A813DGP8_POLGL|nr:unnamed protein product [Polarella glacialis]
MVYQAVAADENAATEAGTVREILCEDPPPASERSGTYQKLALSGLLSMVIVGCFIAILSSPTKSLTRSNGSSPQQAWSSDIGEDWNELGSDIKGFMDSNHKAIDKEAADAQTKVKTMSEHANTVAESAKKMSEHAKKQATEVVGRAKTQVDLAGKEATEAAGTAKKQATEVVGRAKTQVDLGGKAATEAAGTVGEHAKKMSEHAKKQAKTQMDLAVKAATEAAGTAKKQATEVVGQAKTQVDLAGKAATEAAGAAKKEVHDATK